MGEIAIEYGLQILSTLLVTLIGVLGAYLAAKLGKRAELMNITTAIEQVIAAAQVTVGELQQTLVQGWKDQGGGKLTDAQIKELGKLLISKAEEKLSASTVALLEAAKVDVTALIVGAGEDWIQKIKAA